MVNTLLDYKFSNRATEVLAPTTKLSSAIDTVGKMKLDGAPGSGANFNAAIETVTSRLPLRPGDGTSPDRRRVFFILMTDGIANAVYEQKDADGMARGPLDPSPAYVLFPPTVNDGNQLLQGFDARQCRKFPTGASVMTLNTDYVIPGSPDRRYIDIANILKPRSARNMQDCATSKDYVFNASSEAGIKSAVYTMFGSIIATARLTN